MRTPNRLALVAVALCSVAVASLAFAPPARAEFLRAGVQAWTPTGTATVEQISSDPTETGDLSDESGIGLSVYGLLGIFDDVDAGLAIHYLSSVKQTREDKTAFELGSQTDLNLRLAYSLPIPAVLVSIHGEGGLTLFSANSDVPMLPIDKDPLIYSADKYNTDDTSSLGWNAGGGLQLGYSIIPFFSVFVGVDFQVYSVQLFKGSDLKGDDNFDGAVGTDEIETNLSGSRVRFALGVEFNL